MATELFISYTSSYVVGSMSSFFNVLKLKQAKHVQQGPNSIQLLVLKNHENKLKSKTNKNRSKEKFKYIKQYNLQQF